MAYNADRKPGELTALASLATDDVFVVGDTSDASEVAKSITKANLITDLGTSFEAKRGADDNYVTDAEKVVIGNTSGTNTGDNATNTQYSGLDAAKANVAGSLTQFVGNTAYRVFYSDASGDITELALGADGTFLKSNGASVAPSFAVPAGSGDVSKVGTPANNQIGVWTGDGTLEGDASLTYDGTSLNLATAKNFQIAGSTVLADSAGTTTLSNIDALDAGTEATIEGAIDTLANLTSIQGRTVTLADAGANAFFGWDDVAGAYENLTAAEAEAIIEPLIDTLANLTSIQGRTVTLADAGADALLGWDDSQSAYENLTQAEVLAVIGDSTSTAKGVVELAIDSEAVTGSDTARAVTPANLVAKMSAPGAIGNTTPSTGKFTSVETTGNIELGHASANTLSASGGVLSIEGVVIPTISSTNTLTNKRRTRRLTTTNAPGATPTTNTDNVDIMNFTGLNAAITSMTTNLSGTPVDGDLLEFRFTDDGTARGITWGASFAATTVALPTTTVISTMLRVGFEYSGSTWKCIATA